MLPSLHSILTAFAVSATALSLCSCETAFPRTPAEDPSLQGDLNNAKPNPEAGFSYWKDEGATGPVNLKIDLSEQAAYIYRGNTQVGRTRIATGLPTHPTPTGSFTIIEKNCQQTIQPLRPNRKRRRIDQQERRR